MMMMHPLLRKGPMAMLLLSLLGLCLAIPGENSVIAGDQGQRRHLRAQHVYSMYQLPKFDVSLAAQRPPPQEDFSLQSTGIALKQVTETYLHDFMNGSLLGGGYVWDFVHSIDLFVSMRTASETDDEEGEGQVQLLAEMYGTISVQDPEDSSQRPSNDQGTEIFGDLLQKAFRHGQQHIYMKRLKKSNNDLLQNLESVQVTSVSFQEGTPDDKSTSRSGSATNHSPSLWSPREIAIMSVIVCLLLGALLFVALYMRADWGKRRNGKSYIEYDDNHALHHHSLSSSRPSDDAGSRSITNMMASSLMSGSNPAYNGTDGDATVVPVAVDHCHGAITRRYVRTIGESLELLYGASFLHSDREAVELRSTSSRRRAKHRRSNKRRGRRQTQPMSSIAEEPHSVDVSSSDPTTSSDIATTLSAGMRAWMRRLANHNTTTSQNIQHPVVYRDFPRHDGIPRLMSSPTFDDEDVYYDATPKHSNVGAGELNDSAEIVDIDSLLVEESGELSRTDSSFDTNPTEHADNFVNKLERLMAVRYQQYQERLKMERDREQRGFPASSPLTLSVAETMAELSRYEFPCSPSLSPPESPSSTPVALASPSSSVPSARSYSVMATPAASSILSGLGSTIESPASGTPSYSSFHPSPMASPGAVSILSKLNSTYTASPTYLSHPYHSRRPSSLATPAAARVLSQLGAATSNTHTVSPRHGDTRALSSPLPAESSRSLLVVSPPAATSPLPPMRLLSLASKQEVHKENMKNATLKSVVSMDADEEEAVTSAGVMT